MDVVGTEEFAAWYAALSADDAFAVTKAIEVLESLGVDAPHVRVRDVPEVLRVSQRTTLAKMGAFVLPAAFRELMIPERRLSVLLVVEDDGDRVVLLYGTDAEAWRERSGARLASVAEVVLAARVYGIYRKEVA